MKKKCLITIGIIALILGVIVGLVFLAKYTRQMAWEDFTKMHDYINNRNIGE